MFFGLKKIPRFKNSFTCKEIIIFSIKLLICGDNVQNEQTEGYDLF